MKRDSTAYGAVLPSWDKNDCSIRALACAAGSTYEQASALFSVAGRQLKKGTFQDTSRRLYEGTLGMTRVIGVNGWPLAAFMTAYPQGRFILHRRGHAFAVINGILHDWERSATKPGSTIIEAWKITETTLAKIEKTKGLFA